MFEVGKNYTIRMWEDGEDGGTLIDYDNCEVIEISMPLVKFKQPTNEDMIVRLIRLHWPSCRQRRNQTRSLNPKIRRLRELDRAIVRPSGCRFPAILHSVPIVCLCVRVDGAERRAHGGARTAICRTTQPRSARENPAQGTGPAFCCRPMHTRKCANDSCGRGACASDCRRDTTDAASKIIRVLARLVCGDAEPRIPRTPAGCGFDFLER